MRPLAALTLTLVFACPPALATDWIPSTHEVTPSNAVEYNVTFELTPKDFGCSDTSTRIRIGIPRELHGASRPIPLLEVPSPTGEFEYFMGLRLIDEQALWDDYAQTADEPSENPRDMFHGISFCIPEAAVALATVQFMYHDGERVARHKLRLRNLDKWRPVPSAP